MVAFAFLLVLIAQDPSPAQGAIRDLLGPEEVSNRLDCSHREVTEPGGRNFTGGEEVSEIFVFPLRPHRQTEQDRVRVRYLTTLDDGRTFWREGRIKLIEWQRWPRFLARIELDYGQVELVSDPTAPNRLVLTGQMQTSHDQYPVQGECRFVPPIPTL